MARKKKQVNLSPRIVNRRASHDYHLSDRLEVGLSLRGSEVKSIRHGQVSLAEGYVSVDPRTERLMLFNVDIALYPQAGEHQHEPRRPRVLLAHRREIRSLLGKTMARGVTIVPLAIYFVRGRAKLEIAIGTGKKQHDKRQDLKKREAERDMRRAMSRRV